MNEVRTRSYAQRLETVAMETPTWYYFSSVSEHDESLSSAKLINDFVFENVIAALADISTTCVLPQAWHVWRHVTMPYRDM